MLHVAIDARIPGGSAGGVAQVAIGLAQGLGEVADVRRTWIVYPGFQDWLGPWIPAQDDIAVRMSTVERTGRLVARIAPQVVSRLRPHIERLRTGPEAPASGPFDTDLHARGVDVVHLPFQDGAWTGLPSVYQPHDLQHRHLPALFSAAQIRHRETQWRGRAQRASFVSVGTESVRNDIVRFWGVHPDRVRVVPLAPVAPPASHAGELSRDSEPMVLYPAAFWPHKDHLTLVRAIGKLRDQGTHVHLVLPGARVGGAFDAIKNEVRRVGLDVDETLPGYVSADQLRCLYERAWLIVVPSLFESASFPVWEAFAVHKPVVVAQTTALPAQAADGGLVVAQGDVDGFVRAMETLIKDPDLMSAMGEAGARRVAQMTWRRTALATTALWRLAVGGAPRPEEEAALAAETF